MSLSKEKNIKFERRKKRSRAKVFGTAKRPRLSVFHSNRHLWAQLIDDEAGVTLVSASDQELEKGKKSREKKKSFSPEKIGELIAQRAVACGIDAAVFDRGGHKYHGVVKMVAEGARQGGLKI